MKKNKFFLVMLIVLGALFALDCFSIIFCVVNQNLVGETQVTEHVMSIVYMFFHMMILAVVFFFTFKAYMNQSSLLKIFMTTDRGEKNKKAYIISLVVGIVCLTLSIYPFLLILGLNIPLNFFSLGLRFALFNVLFSVGIFFLLLKFYSPEEIKEN